MVDMTQTGGEDSEDRGEIKVCDNCGDIKNESTTFHLKGKDYCLNGC